MEAVLHPTEIVKNAQSLFLGEVEYSELAERMMSGEVQSSSNVGWLSSLAEIQERRILDLADERFFCNPLPTWNFVVIICIGGDKRREIEEVFDIGDLLRLIHGGYDIRVNVTDINGNWATGKTHIDSALQTLKKGLSALLDMIVVALKVIAKVASMLLEIMKHIVEKMLKPILEPIRKSFVSFVTDILVFLKDGLASYVENISHEKSREESPIISGYKAFGTLGVFIGLADLIFNHPLYWKLLLTIVAFQILELLYNAIFVGTAQITQEVLFEIIKPLLISYIIGTIADVIIDFSREHTKGIREFLEGFSFLNDVMGLIPGLLVLYVHLSKIKSLSKLGKTFLADLLAFVFGVFGIIMTLTDIGERGIWLIIKDAIGLVITCVSVEYGYKGKLDSFGLVGKIADFISKISLPLSLLFILTKPYALEVV